MHYVTSALCTKRERRATSLNSIATQNIYFEPVTLVQD